MTNCFGVFLHPDDVRWAAAEGVSETVIAAVLLLHERSVDEIVPKLSAAELEQVIKLVGRSPRVYPPGTLDALKQRRALVAPEPPRQSGEITRSNVAAGKQHAGTPKRQVKEAERERAKQREWYRARRERLRRSVTCSGCKAKFKQRRSDQRFCSAACRQRAHRKRVSKVLLGRLQAASAPEARYG